MYGDVASFKAYHTARGNAVPDAWTDTIISASLLAASEWIDNVYGAAFIGYKTNGFLQVNEWPRAVAIVCSAIPEYIYPNNVIPDRVVNATYEAAYKVSGGTKLQVDYTPPKYASVSVSGAISVVYRQFISASDVQTEYTQIDSILWPLLDANSDANSSSSSGPASRV